MMFVLRSRRAVLVPFVALLLAGFAETLLAAEALRIPHGIASGDVTSTGAVIWARASRAAQMLVEFVPTTAPSPPIRKSGPQVEAKDDFTGKVVLDGLAPDTRSVYWVRFVDPRDGSEVVSEAGQFRTAPARGRDEAACPRLVGRPRRAGLLS